MANSNIKVMLIDDELIAINRINHLLKHIPEIEVTAKITEVEKAFEIILVNEPDLIFLDVEMPGITGLELAEELHKNQIFSKVIFVTSHNHYAIEAIKQNAFDYILKPVSLSVLKEAVERFQAKMYLNLSKRELTILRFIAKGENSKDIAEKLFLSRHTVDTHRRTILEKTNCKNAVELVTYATKSNLI